MRLFQISFLILFLCSGPFFAFAQGDKFVTGGRFNVAVGTGFGIYNLSNNQVGEKDGGALSGNFHLNVDLGILPSLTTGITFFRNSFATNKDSNEAANLGGIGLYAHLNFAKRPKTTWYLNAGFGGTVFTYQNFNNNGKVSASGGYAFAGLGFRRYFGDHIGVFTEVNMTGYNYNQFKYDSSTSLKNQVLKTPSGNDYGIALCGAELKFGLVYAIGSNSK